MANEQNLRPCEYKFTQEDAKKGQIASARKRRESKKFAELFKSFLDREVTDEDLKEALKNFGFSDEELTNKNAMVFAQYRQAVKGNTQAFIAVRDTMGEQPTQKVENINPPTITIERPENK